MIGGKILNSTASINSFQVIQSISFSPGEQIELVVQLFQRQRADQLRYVVEDLAATLSIEIPSTDGGVSTFSLSPFSLDRSIWSVTLMPEDTADLAGGTITLNLNQSGAMSIGSMQNAMQLVISNSGAC